jgi:hypothetical protein
VPSDDERFEIYLKQFRPLMPDALLVDEHRPVPRRSFVLAIGVAGALAMVIIGIASLRILHRPMVVDSDRSGSLHSDSLRSSLLQWQAPTPPLTMHDADALLAKAPSYKLLMNELALRPNGSTPSKKRQSAFAVLGKEKIKL